MSDVELLLKSRSDLVRGLGSAPYYGARKLEAEGGCGVVGIASTEPFEGRFLFRALHQMLNRGNGKGGGIAAAGLSNEQLGVSSRVLQEDYLLQIAYLKPELRKMVEQEFVRPTFDVDAEEKVEDLGDYRSLGLEVRPPTVYRYFVRVKEDLLNSFIDRYGLHGVPAYRIEDEVVYRNSFLLNKKYYHDLRPEDKVAFVLSHGKNMLVFKIVGYGHQVVEYYKLSDLRSHIWIGHHRYPTKGRIWHPGGAHPFVGLHEALVHNGDFANYHSITEYLRQRGMAPLFHTDTEVAVLLFDLWSRVYAMPLEYVMEAMAPTSERDFWLLPEERRRIYRLIQAATIHGSPDGPWFFIIARSNPRERTLQLIGITDTSMLRPQVFALQEGCAKIGLIASEKQAIDATLSSMYEEGRASARVADKYWFARGGSHTDGGAFIFTLKQEGGGVELLATNKFGGRVGG